MRVCAISGIPATVCDAHGRFDGEGAATGPYIAELTAIVRNQGDAVADEIPRGSGHAAPTSTGNCGSSIPLSCRRARRSRSQAKPAVQMLGLAQSAPFLASAGTSEDIRLGFAREPGFARSAGRRDCQMSTLPRAGVPGVTLPAATLSPERS
jgi:hypothetical protein